MNSFRLLVLASLTSASMVSAQQVSTTIAASHDTSLYAESASLSNGAGTRFFAGTTRGGALRRGLLKFDVAGAVPPGSTIQSVRLEMTVAQTRAVDLPVAVHRLGVDWGEAASFAGRGQGGGAAAQTGDATWGQSFFPSTSWQTPGGDFVAASSASVVCGASGTFGWTSAQMVADVQSWLDRPSTAFGWIVITRETGTSSARAFHSREAASVAAQPKLVIGYTPPAATVTSVGSGCTGGGAQPLTLTANGNPTVPAPTFALNLAGGPSSSVLAVDVFFGLLVTPLPIGAGCSFWGDPGGFIVGIVVTGNLPLAVPNLPDLIGRELATQGIAIAPATGAIATSNALVLRFGI